MAKVLAFDRVWRHRAGEGSLGQFDPNTTPADLGIGMPPGGQVTDLSMEMLDAFMAQVLASQHEPFPLCGSEQRPHLTPPAALQAGRPWCVNCGWRP